MNILAIFGGIYSVCKFNKVILPKKKFEQADDLDDFDFEDEDTETVANEDEEMDIRILWRYENGVIILLIDTGHHKDILGL